MDPVKSFLQLVAEDINKRFNGDYSDMTIVFPNKRSSLFFNKSLMDLSNGTPFWSPRYQTISELFEQMSQLTTADQILQICKLYQAYVGITGSTETIDHFYNWGEILLNDFNDIDNNLADADKLFVNIKDLNDLTTFEYLEDEQKRAIEHFFHDFTHSSLTEAKDKFASIWNSLYKIYKTFHSLLSSEGKASSGMLMRSVIEQLKTGNNEQANSRSNNNVESGKIIDRLTSRNYVFVGFNVLNATERELLKTIKQERNALFYWDYDTTYISSDAGSFIRENMVLFPNAITDDSLFSIMRQDTKKNVTIISSPTEDAQARYAAQWVNQLGTIDHKSAVVLCNESLLLPLLHALPDEVNDEKILTNVTMGYPLSSLPILTFIQSILMLQTNGRTQNGVWRHTQVIDVLKNPYCNALTQGASTEILQRIRKEYILFPAQEIFADNEVLQFIFTNCETTHELTTYLSRLTEMLAMLPDQSPLFIQSAYDTHSFINRIATLQETEPVFCPNKITFSKLLKQMMRSKSIPFHGEPIQGLQVMGFLETRNLDFDNILLLSFNEKQVPRISHQTSFIPYTLRNAYGLTTIERQTSVYAYYMYRLLQRSKSITFAYNNSTEGTSSNEMSRFLLQLLTESDKFFAPNVKIRLRTISNDTRTIFADTPECLNTETVHQILLDRFCAKEGETFEDMIHSKFLSPSVINTFIDCRLKFFLQTIAGWHEEDEVTEEVNNAMFGDILHYALESVYRPLIGRQIQSSYLDTLINDKDFIESKIDEGFAVCFFKQPKGQVVYRPHYNGLQLLNKYVLTKYLQSQLEFDKKTTPFTVLNCEDKRICKIDINGMNVRIGGKIDRIDLVNHSDEKYIRIVDYKTSSKAQRTKSIDDLFDRNATDSQYHIRQALFYCELLNNSRKKIEEKLPIRPTLSYVKTKQENSFVEIGKEEIMDYMEQFHDAYDEKLRTTLRDIFDTKESFTKTGNTHNCEYCNFKAYCGR